MPKSPSCPRPLAESEQGTDSAALAMGRDERVPSRSREIGYFRELRAPLYRYADAGAAGGRNEGGHYAAGRCARRRSGGRAGPENNPEWKTVAIDSRSGDLVAPQIHRLPLGRRASGTGTARGASRNRKSSCSSACWACMTTLPRWASRTSAAPTARAPTAWRWTDPAAQAAGETPAAGGRQGSAGDQRVRPAACQLRPRRAGRRQLRRRYDEVRPGSPARCEQITGVSRHNIIRIAREFAENAEDPRPFDDHRRRRRQPLAPWVDMTYRGLINMLIFCGCVGQTAAAGRTTSAGKSCGRKPAGCRWRSASTGAPAAP